MRTQSLAGLGADAPVIRRHPAAWNLIHDNLGSIHPPAGEMKQRSPAVARLLFVGARAQSGDTLVVVQCVKWTALARDDRQAQRARAIVRREVLVPRGAMPEFSRLGIFTRCMLSMGAAPQIIGGARL